VKIACFLLQWAALFTVLMAAGGVLSTRGAIAGAGLLVFAVVGALAPKE
jgi:hypothetical protein